MAHDERRHRKLAGEVARLLHRAVAAGGAGLEPAQHAHLSATEELAAGRGEVVGDRPRQEGVAVERGDVGRAGEVEHHVGLVFDTARLDDLGREDRAQVRAQRGVTRCAHVAHLVGRADKIGRAVGVAAVGCDAAVDQALGVRHACAGEAHGRPYAVGLEGAVGTAVEVGVASRRLAAARAVGRVEAEGEGRGDRHAVDAERSRPGQRVGLDLCRRRRVDRALECGESFARERVVSRWEANVDQVGRGNTAFLPIVFGDRDAVGIVVVDDDAELPGAQRRLVDMRDDGLRRHREGRRVQQQRRDAGEQADDHCASLSTHSRTSPGPR